jgi:patatin-like phospholipase
MSAADDSVASAEPAHVLWVELTTRIITRDLHFRSGREERAVDSVVGLFETTRKLMEANRTATPFLELAASMLEHLRPYTARWHAMRNEKGDFLNPALRREFRAQLQQLKKELEAYVTELAKLSGHATKSGQQEALRPVPFLGGDVKMGIERPFKARARSGEDETYEALEKARNAINEAEGLHVSRRRQGLNPTSKPDQNGIGLALSGGGIRSATFCLGVVQTLAGRKLLEQFDYLSTVSGGGYLGSFMSNQFPLPENPADRAFNASSIDSAQVRHLRNNSKYLLPATALSRLSLAGLLVSGILTTTLLALAIPVAFAVITHFIARAGLLEEGTPFFGVWWLDLNVITQLAAAVVIFTTVLLLVRPITPIWRASRNLIDKIAAYAAMAAGFLIAVAATPWVLKPLQDNWESWQLGGISIAGVAAAGSGALALKAVGYVWKFRKFLAKLVIFAGAVLFALVYLITSMQIDEVPLEGGFSTPEKVVLIALAVWALWACAVNVNLTGLHRYYRDQLAKCYLNPTHPPREGVAEPPALEQMSAELPYHLINTTVNLPSSRNAELRGRGGDFFLMSKEFCGSPIVGYKATPEVHSLNRDLDLATAMAISGAAASTNMGWQTMHQYRTLMAIFNVRLGYWLRWRARPLHWISSSAFVQIVREMFGWMQEKASTLNVSDGGHIENLAAYELIRRKLKYIVCIDGGMDATMTCSDLNRLQRLVAIDFGYRLDFDAMDMQIVNGYSTNYGLLVKIDYTPDEPDPTKKQLGWMLYLKLAMLGTESISSSMRRSSKRIGRWDRVPRRIFCPRSSGRRALPASRIGSRHSLPICCAIRTRSTRRSDCHHSELGGSRDPIRAIALPQSRCDTPSLLNSAKVPALGESNKEVPAGSAGSGGWSEQGESSLRSLRWRAA